MFSFNLIHKKIHLSYSQTIALSFAFIILAGAVLLTLPISAKSGESTPFLDALFTSASATCVTGLVVHDTYTYWSNFGQGVILLLIQIGGLGFMTMAILFSMIIKRRIGLKERVLMREAVNTLSVGGIVRMTRRVLIGTLLFEGVGAVLLSFRFCPEMGFWTGIANAVFHSVSAFCNAGFDLMGRFGEYSSLVRYVQDPLVNLVIMALIIMGGIGFFVWDDLWRNRYHLHKYQLHTKIVLAVTALFIILPAAFIYITESFASLENLTPGTRVLASLFQSVTARTAGFNTVDLTALRESSQFIIIFCMFIGGSPGSTAGGIKTTTFGVLILSILSVIRRKEHMNIFGRKLEEGLAKKANAIMMIYLAIVMTAVMILSFTETFPLKNILFEVFSAIGTVGLTLGITPDLSEIGKVIILSLMYFGRVGILTITFAFALSREPVPVQLPVEKIMIG